MDYGKIICMEFDGKVYNVSSIEKTQYRVIDYYGVMTYPKVVTYGRNDHEVFLHFDNINNLVFPAKLECLQTIAMGSSGVSFSKFLIDLYLDNLKPIPRDFEYMELSAVSVTGAIEILFDGKMYYEETKYVTFSSVSAEGQLIPLVFLNGYSEETRYVAISEVVTVTGVLCDINGIPL